MECIRPSPGAMGRTAIIVLASAIAASTSTTVPAPASPAVDGGKQETWGLTVLHRFQAKGDGRFPSGGLLVGAGGNFFGSTLAGGAANRGTVFELSPHGSDYAERLLTSFTGNHMGSEPVAPLAFGKGGEIVGSTVNSGDHQGGTVFIFAPSGHNNYVETIVHHFNQNGDGAAPDGRLLVDGKGWIFGTTSDAGSGAGGGSVFKLTPLKAGYVESVLYRFGIRDGFDPFGGVVADARGDLFGTTAFSHGQGTVYELTPVASGYAEHTIYRFTGAGDGGQPQGELVIGRDGTIFGTTIFGGVYGFGVAYALRPSGAGYRETVLHSFASGNDGRYPESGLIIDDRGTLYGTTQSGGGTDCNKGGCGTAYTLTPSPTGYAESIIYRFQDQNAGSPSGPLAFDGSSLVGTGESRGPRGYDSGTAFRLTPPGKSAWK